MNQLSLGTKAALQEILETTIRTIPNNWLNVTLNKQIIGAVTPEIFPHIDEFILEHESELACLKVANQEFQLFAETPHELSAELQVLAESLRNKGLITGWRDEAFAYLDSQGHERFRLERAAFRTFGFLSRAVHINGYTSNHKIWLARRSSNKATHPGMLDNFAAGGISADETIRNCAIRELWEEAGTPAHLAMHLNPITMLPVQRLVLPRGLHHEQLFIFDLYVGEEFTPHNQDGEVSTFELYNFYEVAQLVIEEELTPDACVVTADFLLRHANFI